MARWQELEVRMILREDGETRRVRELTGQSFNKDDDSEETVIYNPVMMDLNTVVSFSPFYHEDGSADPARSEIVTNDGAFLVVKMTYGDLIELICK